MKRTWAQCMGIRSPSFNLFPSNNESDLEIGLGVYALGSISLVVDETFIFSIMVLLKQIVRFVDKDILPQGGFQGIANFLNCSNTRRVWYSMYMINEFIYTKKSAYVLQDCSCRFCSKSAPKCCLGWEIIPERHARPALTSKMDVKIGQASTRPLLNRRTVQMWLYTCVVVVVLYFLFFFCGVSPMGNGKMAQKFYWRGINVH